MVKYATRIRFIYQCFFCLGFIGLLSSCTFSDKPLLSSIQPNTQEARGEYIYRRQDESLFHLSLPTLVEHQPYPWEERISGNHVKITKDFFRCKGSSLNPVRCIQKGNDQHRVYDCGGPQKHSLPLREQKEFIYFILIDLLNYIQTKTGKRVVITCGHCCPDHYIYMNPSSTNQDSKHLIGAEVDFYVQNMEDQPEKIIDLIFAYYREHEKYKGLKEFEEFKRYEKGLPYVSYVPWYNGEIFIKLYNKNEGRDFDNRHPYPYVSIQVKYDWDLDEKVTYSWDKAFHNFHRW